MARVPIARNTQKSEATPFVEQRIDAPISSFGSTKGVSNLVSGLEQTSKLLAEASLRMQERENTVERMQAIQQFQKDSTDMLISRRTTTGIANGRDVNNHIASLQELKSQLLSEHQGGDDSSLRLEIAIDDIISQHIGDATAIAVKTSQELASDAIQTSWSQLVGEAIDNPGSLPELFARGLGDLENNFGNIFEESQLNSMRVALADTLVSSVVENSLTSGTQAGIKEARRVFTDPAIQSLMSPSQIAKTSRSIRISQAAFNKNKPDPNKDRFKIVGSVMVDTHTVDPNTNMFKIVASAPKETEKWIDIRTPDGKLIQANTSTGLKRSHPLSPQSTRLSLSERVNELKELHDSLGWPAPTEEEIKIFSRSSTGDKSAEELVQDAIRMIKEGMSPTAALLSIGWSKEAVKDFVFDAGSNRNHSIDDILGRLGDIESNNTEKNAKALGTPEKNANVPVREETPENSEDIITNNQVKFYKERSVIERLSNIAGLANAARRGATKIPGLGDLYPEVTKDVRFVNLFTFRLAQALQQSPKYAEGERKALINALGDLSSMTVADVNQRRNDMLGLVEVFNTVIQLEDAEANTEDALPDERSDARKRVRLLTRAREVLLPPIATTQEEAAKFHQEGRAIIWNGEILFPQGP